MMESLVWGQPLQKSEVQKAGCLHTHGHIAVPHPPHLPVMAAPAQHTMAVPSACRTWEGATPVTWFELDARAGGG